MACENWLSDAGAFELVRREILWLVKIGSRSAVFLGCIGWILPGTGSF